MVNIIQVEGIKAADILAQFEALKTQMLEMQAQFNRPKPNQETYLSRQQVAEKLQISLVTLNDWQTKGFLKGYRMGNRVYFKQSELDAALAAIPARKGGAAQ